MLGLCCVQLESSSHSTPRLAPLPEMLLVCADPCDHGIHPLSHTSTPSDPQVVSWLTPALEPAQVAIPDMVGCLEWLLLYGLLQSQSKYNKLQWNVERAINIYDVFYL